MPGYVIIIRHGNPPTAETFKVVEDEKFLTVIAILEDDDPQPPTPRRVRALIGMKVRSDPWGDRIGTISIGNVYDVLEESGGHYKDGKDSNWLQIEPGWVCEWWGNEIFVVDA